MYSLWFVGMNLLVQNQNHYTTARDIYSVAQEREIEGIYALLMMANKPETALYRAPTFYLLLASHGRFICVILGQVSITE